MPVVGGALYGCAVNNTEPACASPVERAASLGVALTDALEKARASSLRYAAALQDGSLTELADAADDAALDAGRLAALARLSRQHH
jgi:hypothetical protein